MKLEKVINTAWREAPKLKHQESDFVGEEASKQNEVHNAPAFLNFVDPNTDEDKLMRGDKC